MSNADGYVLGVEKLIDNGDDRLRWNLVILGDGYRDAEIETFHRHAAAFLEEFRQTAPFDALFSAINVYRVDVVSTESGARDSGCGTGPIASPRTYFDARFCSEFAGGVQLERLLTVDDALALSVAHQHVPKTHQVLCIVNSTKYGGSGGVVSTFSADVMASKIAIHELGHSAFHLADEYGGNGVGTPSAEPAQANVTLDATLSVGKWRNMLAPHTPLPTSCNPNCSDSGCHPPPSGNVVDVLGTHEGAIYSDCGAYRPLHSCYMRDYGPFCPVCTNVIEAVLRPYLP